MRASWTPHAPSATSTSCWRRSRRSCTSARRSTRTPSWSSAAWRLGRTCCARSRSRPTRRRPSGFSPRPRRAAGSCAPPTSTCSSRASPASMSAVPRLAPVLHIDTVACSAGGEGRDAEEVVAEILPHPLAVLERLVPGGVAALEWSSTRPRPGELRTTAAARGCRRGRAGQPGRPADGQRAAPDRRRRDRAGRLLPRLRRARGRRRCHARARSHIHSCWPATTAGAAAANLTRRAARAQPAYPGLRELIAALYAAVRGDGPAPISPQETLAVARARDALRASQ